ncbi:MAG: AAA family ATPase [Actinobacteria bacterium]|nr:AAA family ATPase [Actinomycetota bacterium]
MMLILCPNCRAPVQDARQVDESGVVCDSCGHRWAFHRLPLFVLTGPSGSGKTSVAHRLMTGMVPEVVFVEQDLFWWGDFRDPSDDYANLGNVCLNLAFELARNRRPIVLVGSCWPSRYETRSRRRFFAETHYVALVSEDSVLRARLEARGPGYWTQAIETMIEWNQMLRRGETTNDKSIHLVDTTGATVEETADEVRHWIRERL